MPKNRKNQQPTVSTTTTTTKNARGAVATTTKTKKQFKKQNKPVASGNKSANVAKVMRAIIEPGSITKLFKNDDSIRKAARKRYLHGLFDPAHNLSRGIDNGNGVMSHPAGWNYRYSFTVPANQTAVGLIINSATRSLNGGVMATLYYDISEANLQGTANVVNVITGASLTTNFQSARHTAFEWMVEITSSALNSQGTFVGASFPAVNAPTQANAFNSIYLMNQDYNVCMPAAHGAVFIGHHYNNSSADRNFQDNTVNFGFMQESVLMMVGLTAGSSINIMIREHVDAVPLFTTKNIFSPQSCKCPPDVSTDVSALISAHPELVLAPLHKYEAALAQTGLAGARGTFRTLYGAGAGSIAPASIMKEVKEDITNLRRMPAQEYDESEQVGLLGMLKDSAKAAKSKIVQEIACSIKDPLTLDAAMHCDDAIFTGSVRDFAKKYGAQILTGALGPPENSFDMIAQ
jgi:hypothetical protein